MEDWTPVGGGAAVDRRGTLTRTDVGWSVEWWVGAEDRWHVPSREPSTRQRLVDGMPVIETSVRVPGGDVTSRAYHAVIGGIGDAAVMEVANQSPVPVVVAWAVVPGVSAVRRIELLGGRSVVVDGRGALMLPGAPRAGAWSESGGADLVARIEGGPTDSRTASVTSRAGRAAAAFVYAVPHGTTIRAVMPRAATGRHAATASVPSSADVGRGWAARLERGTRLSLPAGRLADAFRVNRAFLLLAAGARLDPRVAYRVVAALDAVGLDREARAVLAVEHTGAPDRATAAAASVSALAVHWRLTGDRTTVDEAIPAVALAIRVLGRGSGGWVRRGLLDGAELLRAWGHEDVARRADALLARMEPADEAGDGDTGEDPIDVDGLLGLVSDAPPTLVWSDPAVSACLVASVRRMLVHGAAATATVAVCTRLPEDWKGEGIEVHGAPTELGTVSFAVRWHGERPALLWNVEARPGVDAVQLVAPGLSPRWSTTQRAGEALLE